MSAPALYTPYKIPAWIALSIAVLDQLTKVLVIQFIEVEQNVVIIPGFFHLVHFRNTGAAWGMFRGQSLLLGILSLIILAMLFAQFRNLSDRVPERAMALSLIAGGIVGNLIDRFGRGEVVDFLHFFYNRFQWPAFNIADSAITCGVVVYIASTLLRSNHERSNA